MCRLDLSKTGGPVAIGDELLRLVDAVGEGGAQGQLPVAPEFRQAPLYTTAGIAAPCEIGVEVFFHRI
jgi:hypothetical protein